MAAPEYHNAIAVDAMGGDLGPGEVVAAVALFFQNLPRKVDDVSLVLVGDERILSPAVEAAGLSGERRLSIHHATEVISMEERPLRGLKRKKDSSMVRALELVQAKKARALLSCGNTGSLMAGGTLKIRPLEGIERPALASIIPTREEHFILIDAGANPEPTPHQLLQNALLGSNYAKVHLRKDRPRIGLLTIGTEEGKGGGRTQEAHELLKQAGEVIDYQGLIEGFQVFENHVDVIVCDGFVGNIVLKVCESLFSMLKGYVKDELNANPVRKLGALLSIGAYKEIKGQLDPARYGGAPLLGLKAPVFKAHGSSNRETIAGALRIIRDTLHFDITEHILGDLERLASTGDAAPQTLPSPVLEKEVAS